VFGLTTAASYAWSGLISWSWRIVHRGRYCRRIDRTVRRGALMVFAAVIIAVALYMLARTVGFTER
jgi:hypothetical protein